MAHDMIALIQKPGPHEQNILSKEKIKLPEIEAHQMLVKVSHAAQNPTDIQSLDSKAFDEGAVLGCDFVGTVEAVGKDVTRAVQGDIVAGLIWGGEIKGLGAYAEYTVADQAISFKLPSSIPPTAASTIPLAATTAYLALFSKDCLNIDRAKGKETTVLVWGGSSSVGLYTIQLAALHNITVITTCSPRNFDLVRKAGATHVFNHADADVVEKITSVAPRLAYIFDTIGNVTSSETASKAIQQTGKSDGTHGKLCTVRPGKANTQNVTPRTEVTDVLVWTAFLKEHRYGDFYWPPQKDDHKLASELFEKMPSWLEEGKIEPNPISVKKGLDAVQEGFQEYRDGKISAYKIVYEV